MNNYRLSIISATTGSRYDMSVRESSDNMKAITDMITSCLQGKCAFLTITNPDGVMIALPAAVLLSSIIQIERKGGTPNG